MRGNLEIPRYRHPIVTMGVGETFAHDFRVIARFLKNVGMELLKALFTACFYAAVAIWFIFNLVLEIAWLLTIRDATQWFLGTNRRRR